VSPLKIPVGAHIVDTTALTIEEQVRQVIDIARRTAERRRALVIPRGKRNPWRRQRMVWRLSRGLIMILLKVLWGLRVVRKDNLDYGENFIFASNHHSNADPPVIGSTCPREIHFVAKATLFTWSRAFAWLIAMYNAIPIRRGQFDREAMDRCLELLANGESVLIFPEGGRQRGPELGPARPGVGYLALNSGCSVVPIYVDGTQSMLRALLRRPRLTIRLGRPIRLDRTVIERSRNAEGYREFSHMVMAAIQALRDENVA
jgi:1-acyl-sn-glycerol-3-phosphate acyltransferase